MHLCRDFESKKIEIKFLNNFFSPDPTFGPILHLVWGVYPGDWYQNFSVFFSFF